jgi:hypothetical protein
LSLLEYPRMHVQPARSCREAVPPARPRPWPRHQRSEFPPRSEDGVVFMQVAQHLRAWEGERSGRGAWGSGRGRNGGREGERSGRGAWGLGSGLGRPYLSPCRSFQLFIKFRLVLMASNACARTYTQMHAHAQTEKKQRSFQPSSFPSIGAYAFPIRPHLPHPTPFPNPTPCSATHVQR